MGFSSYVPNRIPDYLKQELQHSQSMEFLWQGIPPELTGKEAGPSPILTHVLDEYGYCPPNQPRNLYFWDDYTYWTPLGGAPQMNSSSVPPFAARMASFVHERAAWFQTDLLMFPWGCDFEFQNATAMFSNMDRVVAFVNAHGDRFNFTLEYATLKEYFAALAVHKVRSALHSRMILVPTPLLRVKLCHACGQCHSARMSTTSYRLGLNCIQTLKVSFETKERADMLPYALIPFEPPVEEIQRPPPPPSPQPPLPTSSAGSLPTQSWWSGEFTSWPLMKKMTRAGASALRSAEQLNTLACLQGESAPTTQQNGVDIAVLRRASAEAQHHDAVDGTSPDRTTRMWEDHLAEGGRTTAAAVSASVATLLADDAAGWQLNPADAGAKLRSGGSVRLAVHNPLPWVSSRTASMPVPRFVKVYSINGTTAHAVPADTLPYVLPADVWPRTNHTMLADTDGMFELVFVADNIPPLGFLLFTIVPTKAAAPGLVDGVRVHGSAPVHLSNRRTTLLFNGPQLVQVGRDIGSTTHHTMLLRQDVVVYNSSYTNNDLASNNYKFEPTSPGESLLLPVSGAQLPNVTFYQGAVVEQLVVQYAPHVIQRFRLVKVHTHNTPPPTHTHARSAYQTTPARTIGHAVDPSDLLEMQVEVETSVGYGARFSTDILRSRMPLSCRLRMPSVPTHVRLKQARM
jgi:hypothetical protein